MSKKQVAIEVTMMLAAQQLVDRWLAVPGPWSFPARRYPRVREHWSDMHGEGAAARIPAPGKRHPGRGGSRLANPGPLLKIRSAQALPLIQRCGLVLLLN